MAVRPMTGTGAVMMIIQVCCEVEQIFNRNPERGALKDSNYLLFP